MQIESLIKTSLQSALREIYNVEEQVIALQPTKKDFEGFYTFVTFPYTKSLRKPPVEIGNALGQYLVEHSGVCKSQVFMYCWWKANLPSEEGYERPN
jgi:arginyl-tRNA synthetase